jgi:hypothetical protein
MIVVIPWQTGNDHPDCVKIQPTSIVPDESQFYIPLKETKPFKCPVCDGTGHTYKPPLADPNQWTNYGESPYRCHACSGTGVVWNG